MFRRRRSNDDFAEEIRAHLALEAEELKSEGLSEAEAERRARVAFGNVHVAQERFYLQGRAAWLDNFVRDLRFVLRQFVKNPGFAVTAILVLALGMGASVTIFAFVDAALIKPLPYRQPDRLVSVYETVQSCPLCNVSYMNYQDWKRSDLPFRSLEVWGWSSYLVNTPTGTEPAQDSRVSDGFFRTLGVAPVLGRDFYPGEDRPGMPHTLLISYSAWQKRFGGAPDVVGKQITLDNISYTIIGVLPKAFHFAPRGEAEFWAALNDPSSCDKRRGCHGLFGLARLKDGISLQTASAAMETAAERLEKQYPDSNHGFGATVTSLSDAIAGGMRAILLVLLSGACLLFVIALVNVASLLMVRAESRSRETAVRGALGASTARLLRQFVTESLVLVLAGSVLGLGLAQLGMKLLIKLIPARRMEAMPYLLDMGLNGRVLGFAVLLSLLAATLFAVIPAVRLLRRNLRGDLAEGSRGSAGNTWRRLGSRLVVVELATAVVLLAGAGLLVKSFYLLLHVDMGFEPDHLATLVVTAPKSYADGDRFMVLERELVRQIGNLPGVKSAGISSSLPVRSWDGGVAVVVPGRTSIGQRNDLPERDVSFSYLETLDARLVRGRYFTEAEDDGSKRRVVVINQTLAKQFFPGEDPIGRHLAYEGSRDLMEIIGEVQDIKEGQLDTPSRGVLYVPFNQDYSFSFNLIARTSQAEQTLLPTLAAAVHRIDPSLATSDPTPLAASIDDSNSAYLHRSAAWIVGWFAVMALVLGVVGLYGVIAYSVSQRTREIGVRMALGARRGTVYGMVMGQAGRLTAVGLGIGLVCSVGASLLMRKLLFGVAVWDVPTLASVAAVLGIAAMAASFLPARRAAGVNPVEALRAE